MKHSILFRSLLFAWCALSIVSCGEDKNDEDTDKPVAVKSISLEPQIAMFDGDTLAIVATVLPENATSSGSITWLCSDETVATFSSGSRLVALRPGQATITAIAGAYMATSVVTVNPTRVTSVVLDNQTYQLGLFTTFTLSATVLPTNATYKTVTWTSDDTTVATVDSATGVVTGVSVGTANITATADGQSSSCAVSVVILPAQSITVGTTMAAVPTGASLNCASFFSVLPTTATYQTLSYSTADPTIATVNASGVVTFVSQGQTELFAHTTDGSNITSSPVTIYSGYSWTKYNSATSGWTVWASTVNSGYPASRIVDNNETTFWNAEWGDNVAPYPYYLLIDMQTPKTFSRLYSVRRSNNVFLRDLEYYITPLTTDGVAYNDPSFSKIGEVSYGTNSPVTDRYRDCIFLPTTYTTRYILLKIPNTNGPTITSVGVGAGDMCLAELYVYNMQ
ncbi:MAG: Ig-like domain-containing protein [Rikenellaceae bacterium]|jgi:uncharacterized protein YjdB|nr:Ig-like domain-containing protein [Rikenellaceae bacterium]